MDLIFSVRKVFLFTATRYQYMEIGYRIFDPGDALKFDSDFIQVSVWHKEERDVQRMKRMCERLRSERMPYIAHLLGLYLSDTRPQREVALSTLKEYAKSSGGVLILHDETLPGGARLHGPWRKNYARGLEELQRICRVSIENSNDSSSALWFWKEFADSITFDIGHFVSAGIDVLNVIDGLSEEHIEKLDYIHVHRHNGWKPIGISDHWALERDCVELRALRKLLDIKNDVGVVVEVDGEDELRRSMDLVYELRGSQPSRD